MHMRNHVQYTDAQTLTLTLTLTTALAHGHLRSQVVLSERMLAHHDIDYYIKVLSRC